MTMAGLDAYLKELSSPQSETLQWLEKQTHLRTNHARMLSGSVVGTLLKNISLMISPSRILELGTFTGYSSICLSAGLGESGVIDTIELNDELEDLIRSGFNRAGISDKVNLIFGDAKDIIPTLDHIYDLVYIDANKREYSDYFTLVIDKVRKGGYIIADNVLWDGKVYDGKQYNDAQTKGILAFNQLVRDDSRVENVILPIRDGLNLIRIK